MRRKPRRLVFFAAACLLLMLFGLIASAMFANQATRQWYDRGYRYEKAHKDVLENFKRDYPGSDPNSGPTPGILKTFTQERMWNVEYDPPSSRKDQGIANVCGMLGILGLLGVLVSFVIMWRARKKKGLEERGQQKLQEMPSESRNESGDAASRVAGTRGTGFKGAVETVKHVLMTPQLAFIVIGLLFGLIMLVVNPPFRAVDENAHFAKAYSVSEGQLIPEVRPGQSAFGRSKGVGSTAPHSIQIIEKRTKFWPPTPKVKVDDITSSLLVPLGSSHKAFLDYAPWGSSIASPIAYIPQALGILVGRIFHLSTLLLMYMGRLFNLLFFLLMVYISIAISPILKWTFFLLGLMPLTMNLAASLSYDTPLIAISFLFIAYMLYMALEPRKQSIVRKDVYFLILFALLLALIKQPYFLLLVLFFIIPSGRFRSRKEYYFLFALLIALAILVAGGWGLLLRTASQPAPAGISPRGQLRMAFSNWLNPLRVLYHTLKKWMHTWIIDFVGGLGWFNVILPAWFAYVYIVIMGGVSALDKDGITVRLKQKAIGFGTALLIMAAVLAILYVTGSQVGAPTIDSFNARYFLPVAPLFFLLFYNKRFRYKKGKFFYVFLTGFTFLSIFIAMFKLIRIYY